MPEPNHLFTIWRADEVAECMDGVTQELYIKLWRDIVSLQKPIPNIEDSGPADHVGHECLAKYWDKLTPVEQSTLNQLAQEHNAKYWRK